MRKCRRSEVPDLPFLFPAHPIDFVLSSPPLTPPSFPSLDLPNLADPPPRLADPVSNQRSLACLADPVADPGLAWRRTVALAAILRRRDLYLARAWVAWRWRAGSQ